MKLRNKLIAAAAIVAGAGTLAAGSVIAQSGPMAPGHAAWQAHGDGPGAGGHGRGGRRGWHGGGGEGHRMERMIERFDADGDGSITREEVIETRTERLNSFDTDGNGTLSLEEYQALWLDAMRERMVDQFQAHDDVGDGVVTVEDFTERFDRMVRRLDRNGDGVIDATDRRRPGRDGGRRGPAPDAPAPGGPAESDGNPT